METVRKHRNIKLVATKRRRNCSLSEPNNHNTKFLTEDLLAIEMGKIQILINKPVHLGLLVLDLGKAVMYESVKPKYGENANLCYMDTDTDI